MIFKVIHRKKKKTNNILQERPEAKTPKLDCVKASKTEWM